MPESLSGAAVWSLLERIAECILNANLPGFKVLFVIGSLAGGYYKPGQSDVDLVALFAGSPPAEDETKRLAELLEALVGERPANLDIDILPRYESDLAIDPDSGLYFNPDLVARLLIQSKKLAGSYDLSQLKMPGPRDFQAEFPSQLSWWRANHGPLETCAQPLQAKYLLLVLRSWMAVLCKQLIYNKTELIAAYWQANPSQPLTPALEHFLAKYLMAEPIKTGYEKELLTFCGQLSSEILSLQL
jgi:predicted nucleotidyltransferase